MLEAFQSAIPTILLVLIEVIVVLAGIGVVGLIKKLTTKFGIEINDSMMVGINRIVNTAVVSINQRFTDKYKAANENHKLTEEQQREVFERTKDIIMSSLSTIQLEALMAEFGMTADEAVDMLIEEAVNWNHK